MDVGIGSPGRSIVCRTIREMCIANRPWQEVQQYFRRNNEACSDSGYFEALMVLWKNHGAPNRMRFFRSAFGVRTWNPIWVMTPEEHAVYEALPSKLTLTSTRPTAPDWIEYSFADGEPTLPLRERAGAVQIETERRRVFAVQRVGERTTLLVH